MTALQSLLMPRRAGKSTAAAKHETQVLQARLEFKARHRCTHCTKELNDFHPFDDYMLTPETWSRVHPYGFEGFVCHDCLYKIVGTSLTRQDLTSCLAYINRTVIELSPQQRERLSAIEEFRLVSIKQADYIRTHWLPALPPVFAHLGIA